jgi:hypothetical protein
MDWTSIAIGTSLFIAIASPYITSTGISWKFTENMLFRLLLVLYVAMNIRLGALPGLLALLAVFSLYIERSHLLLAAFPNQKPILPGPHGGQATTVPIPFDTPKGVNVNYEPEEEKGLSVVERHGEGTTYEEFEKAEIGDSNPRLAEGPQGSDEGTEFFEERGLA